MKARISHKQFGQHYQYYSKPLIKKEKPMDYLRLSYLTVQTEGEQHDEEENGPQRGDG